MGRLVGVIVPNLDYGGAPVQEAMEGVREARAYKLDSCSNGERSEPGGIYRSMGFGVRV